MSWVTTVVLLSLCGAASANGTYTLVPLGTFGGTSSGGNDINRNRQAVGRALNTTPAWRGFNWQTGSMADLGTLGGTYSFANRINKHGDIVGSAATSGNAEVHAVVWGSLGVVDMGTISGYQNVQGLSINDSGEIVGEAHLRPITAFALPISQAFYSGSNGMIALPTLGGRYSRANDLNDKNDIVGSAELSTSDDVHAVLWTKSNGKKATWAITDIGTLPGFASSVATAVNKHQQIVGWSFTNTFSSAKAFSYENGTMVQLPDLGGNLSSANGINRFGEIVGWSQMFATNIRHAVLWQNGQIIDLNTLLPAGSGWVLNNAAAINDRGDIIGTGTDPTGKTRGFILELNYP